MAVKKSDAAYTVPFIGKKDVIIMMSVQDGTSTASAAKLDYNAVHALEQMIIDLTFDADTPQTKEPKPNGSTESTMRLRMRGQFAERI